MESELSLVDEHPRKYALIAADGTKLQYRTEFLGKDFLLIPWHTAVIWKTNDIDTANAMVDVARLSRTTEELNRKIKAELHSPQHQCILHNRLSEHTLAVMVLLSGAHTGWPEATIVARWRRTDTSKQMRRGNNNPILVGWPFPEGFGDSDIRLFELLEAGQLR